MNAVLQLGPSRNTTEAAGFGFLGTLYTAKNEPGAGQTGSWGALRGGDGSRHSRCRFVVLQKPILGTADSKYWNCLGVRSFLFEIPQASMTKARPRLNGFQLIDPKASAGIFHKRSFVKLCD
jgi:hypothetical protein